MSVSFGVLLQGGIPAGLTLSRNLAVLLSVSSELEVGSRDVSFPVTAPLASAACGPLRPTGGREEAGLHSGLGQCALPFSPQSVQE